MVKDLEYRSGQVFKGGRAGRWCHTMSLRDVRHLLDVRWRGLRHGPGNRHLQMMSPVPCALTASWMSIAKAGGLSDAPGAERSPNGKMEILWHPPLDSCQHPRWHLLKQLEWMIQCKTVKVYIDMAKTFQITLYKIWLIRLYFKIPEKRKILLLLYPANPDN